MRRLPALLLTGLLAAFQLDASLCLWHDWTLPEIARAPVLVVARVVSLHRANGPHFTGDPRHSAPAQNITANVEVLRFNRQSTPDSPRRHAI